jgi:hypothetical protein
MKCARCQDTVTHVVSVHYSATVPGPERCTRVPQNRLARRRYHFILLVTTVPPWMTTVIDKSRSPKLEPIREIPSAVLW